jgi:hypothetical protein
MACPDRYWQPGYVVEAVPTAHLPDLLARAKASGVIARPLAEYTDLRNVIRKKDKESVIRVHHRRKSKKEVTSMVVWRTQDSTTFHAFNPSVQQFFELGG